MKINTKALAILAGLTVGMSSTAFAATADSFTDVPKDHWSYQALDYLAKEGVIEGMGDSTFQGSRAMTRYEMAAIVAKAMQKNDISFGDKAVLDKLSAEYANELGTLKNQVNKNTNDINDLKNKTDKFKVWGMTRVQVGDDNGLVKDGHNGTYNNRFYMDLEGSMKVNDHATARFTVEKNAHYRDSEYANSKIPKMIKLTRKDGTTDYLETTNAISGIDKDSLLGDDNHNGSISNIWVELQLGKNHNWYTNIGRKWNGIGMQNLMLGGQVDGIATYHPIEGGHGWWMSAQYWKPSSDWTDTNVEWTTDENGNGVAKAVAATHRAPILGTLNFWGPLGKYIDANIAYSHVVQHQKDSNKDGGDYGYWTGAKNFWGADLKVKLLKDLSVTGSYVKSDVDMSKQSWANGGHADRDWAVRIDYKGTDLNKVGSWGAYAKWMNLGCMGDIGHDDEWATREPTFVNGVKGWYYGFKMVPWQNCEWETMWAPHLTENSDANRAGDVYTRHILRSWLDFHF